MTEIRIKDEKGNIITNTNEIQRIIWTYFENLYSSKLESFKAMYECLNAFNEQRLNQEDNNHPEGSVTSNETDAVTVSQKGKSRT
jgi:RNA-binding protein YlmH